MFLCVFIRSISYLYFYSGFFFGGERVLHSSYFHFSSAIIYRVNTLKHKYNYSTKHLTFLTVSLTSCVIFIFKHINMYSCIAMSQYLCFTVSLSLSLFFSLLFTTSDMCKKQNGKLRKQATNNSSNNRETEA